MNLKNLRKRQNISEVSSTVAGSSPCLDKIVGTLSGDGTRIISMRKGNRREQKIYQERLGTD
jgi:uncharacterized DUF497 family protein